MYGRKQRGCAQVVRRYSEARMSEARMSAGNEDARRWLRNRPEGECCFVLLIPTPEEYRVPRVNPGVTASKLFPPLLPSLATPGPPLPYRPLQNIPVLLSEVQSGVQHLLGLISGLRRGGRGIPISSLVVEMDRLLSRRLRLSNSCPSSPVPARWPALGRRLYVCGMCG